MKGRTFALAAVLAGGCLTAAAAPGEGPKAATVTIADGTTAPVIARLDVLVVDASLPGCLLACRLAGQGQNVALVSTGTSMPREMLTCLRPWADERALAGLPKDLSAVLAGCVSARDGGQVIFAAARLARAMEDMVLDAGVRLYYDLQPCGVVRSGGRVSAVLLGGKAGLVAIESDAVVDCTPDGRLAAMAGARLAQRTTPGGTVEAAYTMFCKEPMGRDSLAVGGVGELVDGKVTAHGPFVEFRMRLPAGRGPMRAPPMGVAARRVVASAGQALRRGGGWKDASFVRGGDELFVQPTRRIPGRGSGDTLTIEACRPGGLDNLLVCGPAADVDDATARQLADPLGGVAIAELLASADWAAIRAGAGRDEKAPEIRLAAAAPAGGADRTRQARFDAVGPVRHTGRTVALGGVRLPVMAECDVLVVGAGTSGVPAALVAARQGRRTILLDKHGDVGGTQTIGGVSVYWFGRQTDFVNRLDREVAAAAGAAGMPRCIGLLELLVRAGVDFRPNCLAVGSVVAGRRVTGVVVLTPEGLAVLGAQVVIDATGDGDLAARAGGQTRWGTARDAMTLWYSFGQFVGARPEASRNFDSPVDLRDPADVSRAMVTSRRRKGIFGAGDFPQIYLAPRESRHVVGRADVTYADILTARRPRDTVAIARANFDIKGIADSDLAQCGYAEKEFRRNYSAWIPYGAMLPADLEGLLVIGKAMSVTHDALALARMQRDLIALGAAAGRAAAMACQTGAGPAEIDVPALQRGLVELGVLTEADLADLPAADEPAGATPGEPQLRSLAAELAAGRPELASEVRLLQHPQAARPILVEALAAAQGPGRLRLARALCFLGDKAGADAVLEALRDQLGEPTLPASPQKAHSSPDHGYAPEPCFLINVLGRAGDRRVVELLAPLARRIRINPQRSGDMFQYVFAICYASERLADPAAVEALRILADKPGIRGQAVPADSDPRKTVNVPAERYAYLELCVGRALARCGSRRGYEILIGYLADARAFLARSARQELADLAGRDLGFDPAPWRAWLVEAPAPLPPRPYSRHID